MFVEAFSPDQDLSNKLLFPREGQGTFFHNSLTYEGDKGGSKIYKKSLNKSVTCICNFAKLLFLKMFKWLDLCDFSSDSCKFGAKMKSLITNLRDMLLISVQFSSKLLNTPTGAKQEGIKLPL